jgi:two-component system response regulator AtoC
MERFRIAVIDDEPIVGREIKRGLAREPYEVETFVSGEEVLQQMEEARFHVALCDLRMPGKGGLEVLREIQERYQPCEVIVITAHGGVDSAIEAIRAGAFHYVTKPVKMAEIRLLIKRALEKVVLIREKEALKEALFSKMRPDEMIGNSRAMCEVFRLIEKVAPLGCNVLIHGESGTGKEMVARALHRQSPRSKRPFVSFNCGGFAEELITNELFGHEKGAFTGATETKIGLLEAANGGTLFLDEISEMPPSMQVKLLRVVEERRLLRVGGVTPLVLDVRLLAASNRSLKEMVDAREFREDLYYRLNVVTIDIPPLRSRKDDIPLLLGHFLERYCRVFGKRIEGVSDEVTNILNHYPFPGNVRELAHIVERAVALAEGSEIITRDLPSDLRRLSMSRVENDAWPTLEAHEAPDEALRPEVTGDSGFKMKPFSFLLILPQVSDRRVPD